MLLVHRRVDPRHGADRRHGLIRFARRQRVFGHLVDLHVLRRHVVDVAHGDLDRLAVPDQLVEALRCRADALRKRAGADHPHRAVRRILHDVEGVVNVAAERGEDVALRQLGDDAARPRFIETIPKHGYRFVAAVDPVGGEAVPAGRGQPASPWRQPLLLGLAGTVGGGVAGLIGGLFYGFAAAQPAGPGMGAASVLIVLVCVTILVALIGAAGVAFGIAAAAFAPGRLWQWSVLGGGFGGLVVGAFVKLLGVDAFNLLLGSTPQGITGAPEGALLGASVGSGAWLAMRGTLSFRRSIAAAAALGGAAGVLIPLLGGRLMGGSLALLADSFPDSRLRLDQIGSLFGESGFGPVSRAVTGGVEGLLFAGCIVGAMLLAQRGAAQDA